MMPTDFSKLNEKEKRDAVREEMTMNLTEAFKNLNIQTTKEQIKTVFEDIALSCDSCDFACKHFVIL